MALGMNQPLTEMSIGNISRGVKMAVGLGGQPYHRHVPIVREIWEPQTPRALMVCPGLCTIPLPSLLNVSMTSSEVKSCYGLTSTFLVHILLHFCYRSAVKTGLLCLVLKFSAWFRSNESNIFSFVSRGVKLETSGFSHSKRQVFPTAEPSLVKSSHPLP